MEDEMIPSKIEEIQEELNADAVREKSNEISDGEFDAFVMDNYETLVNVFLNDYNDEWKDFCKTKWNEENE